MILDLPLSFRFGADGPTLRPRSLPSKSPYLKVWPLGSLPGCCTMVHNPCSQFILPGLVPYSSGHFARVPSRRETTSPTPLDEPGIVRLANSKTEESEVPATPDASPSPQKAIPASKAVEIPPSQPSADGEKNCCAIPHNTPLSRSCSIKSRTAGPASFSTMFPLCHYNIHCHSDLVIDTLRGRDSLSALPCVHNIPYSPF